MKRKIIPYKPELKEKARKLRNNSTLTEIMLWQQLKGRQIRGYDFHRQKPLGKYIVDFFCNELNLAIEVDGESHFGKQDYDALRQNELEKLGVLILRFSDMEVRYNLEGAVKSIEKWIDKHK
jgi:very-short-patch-repair endonuclease